MPRKYPFGNVDQLDLDPVFAELRQRDEPITRVQFPYGGDGWLVTGYEEIKLVSSDPRFSRAATVGREDVPRLLPMAMPAGTISAQDPPEHTRLRRLIAKAFSPSRIDLIRSLAQRVMDDLLDQLQPPAELVRTVALPFPATIISEMLGVPEQDRTSFYQWVDRAAAITAYSAEEIAEGNANLMGYIGTLVAQRRENPTDDLIGVLVSARDGSDRLSEQELIGLGTILLLAGHETTANMFCNSLYTLLTHPEQLARLRAEPQLLPSAIEELLRFVPLIAEGDFSRIATEDVKVGDTMVAAGDALVVYTPSANRDATVFPDPDQLDIARDSSRQLSFGHGVHFCPGAQLARMELEIALGSVLRRFPTMELVEVTFKPGRQVRGPATMVVSW